MTDYTFKTYPKIPRLNKLGWTITEKIDGTNGLIRIVLLPDVLQIHDEYVYKDLTPVEALTAGAIAIVGPFAVFAGSRSRWLKPGKTTDNFGFAQWVYDNADQLVACLGEGSHYGEWWGLGIQRGYGQQKKWFTLFNPDRYPQVAEAGVQIKEGLLLGKVPVLSRGNTIDQLVYGIEQGKLLLSYGSFIVPSFPKPEGFVVQLQDRLHKVILDGDETKVAG